MSGDKEGSGSNDLAWYDFQPEQRPQDGVKYLRVGFQEQRDSPLELIDAGHRNLRDNLKMVQINLATVRSIGSDCFHFFHALEQVEFMLHSNNERSSGNADDDNSGENGDISYSANLEPAESQLVSIGAYAFSRCTSLKNLIGLEQAATSLRQIHVMAFFECKSLTRVDFLSAFTQLERLGPAAFSQCASLTRVDLSKTLLTDLHRETFDRCRALNHVELPSCLQSIRSSTAFSSAFENCGELATVTFHSSSHLRSCLNNDAFLECPSLHTLELPGHMARALWPRALEQFLKAEGILGKAGIQKRGQRVTIAWNYFRNSITNFFLEDNNHMNRRRVH